MRTALTTPPGGVMTDEAGAITGQVEVWLEGTTARATYVGSKDVYTVTGSPVPDDTTLEQVLARLHAAPPADEYGNAVATDVQGLS
jgi:hypothetical protein